MILIGRGLDLKEKRFRLRPKKRDWLKLEKSRTNCKKRECAVFKVWEIKVHTFSGGDGKRVPPVPIPNTEVKPLSAEGTWLDTAREIRSLPDSNRDVLTNVSFFSSPPC